MTFKFVRLFLAFGCFLLCAEELSAQGYSFNCARDTLVPGCPASLCITLKTLIPDPSRAAPTYAVNSPTALPSCLLASGNPGVPGAPTTLNIDDKYSPAFPIGFPFVFFGTPYNDLVVSSNGYLSFNTALTGLFSHYGILNSGGSLSATTGTPQNLPSTLYDGAVIMGPYHDIDVSVTTSPNRLISYQTSGLAPYRKWTLTYYKIPLFSGACNNLIENTHQITLYESTGIIDVNIFDKQICNTWNQGRAMIGVQDITKTKGVMAPGRAASDAPWGGVGQTEKWRFVPTGGTPLFRRVELYDLSGTLVTTGTTVALPNGDREASFPNICIPPGGSQQFVVKAFYDKIDDPAVEIYGTDTIKVDRTQALVATPSATTATCGSSNGSITVNNTTGGTGPYEYSLDGVTWQSSNVFNGIPAGTHTVYIRDALGSCTATYSVTVPVVSNLTANVNNTASSCTGVNNGTITVTSSNGTGPFTYSLDSGPFQAGALPYTFTGLAPGSHTVVVKDVNGCITNTISVTITTGTGVTASSSVTATSCAGANNGAITITPTAGTAPFSYQIDGGGFNPGTSPQTFTGLTSGVHTIIIRDNVGCTRTLTVSVPAGSGLTAGTSSTPTSCFGASDGTITVTPTTGTAPYTYSVDNGPFVPGPVPYTFTGLSGTIHTVAIKDANGCATNAPLNVIVSSGGTLVANATTTATSCSGSDNGSITITPLNGAGPYSFSLDNAAPVTGPVPYTFTNVAAGNHNVVVTTAAGCASNPIPANVVAGAALTTTASKTDVLCNAGMTGTITVAQPSTGTAPFEYSLDGVNWQTSNVFSGLAAGTYTVHYREASGCSGTLPMSIAEPPVLSATSAATAVSCNGGSNGAINITPSGGVGPYEYSLDGTTWQPSNSFAVTAGNYTVTIRDANGCTTTQSVNVSEPPVLSAVSANTAASCDGGDDGVITVTATGGNSTYSYSLDGVNFQSSNIFNVGPGTYTVTVKDNMGCTTSFPTTVLLGNNFSLTPQSDVTICEGTSTQLSLTSNATEYSWSPATGLSATNIYNPVANPTVTTEYIVTATLGRCSGEDRVIVNVNAAPVPNAGADGFICYGQTYQLNGSGGTQYAWSPRTSLSDTSIANPVASPTRDMTYTLSILSDANGCKSLVTDQVKIDVTPPIKVKTFPFDTTAYTGDQIQLLAVASDPDVIRYEWTPTIGLSDAGIANPVATAGAVGSVIQYRVVTSTIAGCKGEGFVTVKVYKGPDIYVPTAFTPNNDGRNDVFIPFPVGIKQYNYFKVFNRWGQMIYSTTRMQEGWDGRLGGKEQPSGTYVWMIEGVTDQNKVITKKGTITLIR